jgi:hypothetical protein
MDNLENSPAPEPSPNAEPIPTDWQEAYDSLRYLVVFLLVMLIVVSGTFSMFLWRQYRWSQTDLVGVRQQVSALAMEYKRNTEPVINDFVGKLVEYSKTHPDFNPILAKYGIKPGVATGGPAPSATAPAALPKK